MSNNHSLREAHNKSRMQPRARTVLPCALLFPSLCYRRHDPLLPPAPYLHKYEACLTVERKTRETKEFGLQARTLPERNRPLPHRSASTSLWKGGHSQHRLSSREVVEVSVAPRRKREEAVSRRVRGLSRRQVDVFCGEGLAVQASLPSLHLQRPSKKLCRCIFIVCPPSFRPPLRGWLVLSRTFCT